MQSVAKRAPLSCFEAGQDGRYTDGVRAIKLEAAPQLPHFKSISYNNNLD